MKVLSAVIAVLLCTLVATEGVKMMSFHNYIEREGSCAIDWKAWDTAIDFVANRSTKLKLKWEHDHNQQGKQLADEMDKVTDKIVQHIVRGTRAENELFKQRDEGRDRYDNYVRVPRLSFYIMTMDLVRGCAGTVRAKVAVVLRSAEIMGTDKTIYFPTVEIWSDGSVLSGPFDTFSSFTIQTSEQALKNLVNDWAKAHED
jgi:hypothetical protein